MRTTLELPDDLLRQAKIAAVRRGSTLRDLMAQALRRELSASDASPRVATLPVIRLAADAPLLTMTMDDLRAALDHAQAEDDHARAG